LTTYLIKYNGSDNENASYAVEAAAKHEPIESYRAVKGHPWLADKDLDRFVRLRVSPVQLANYLWNTGDIVVREDGQDEPDPEPDPDDVPEPVDWRKPFPKKRHLPAEVYLDPEELPEDVRHIVKKAD